MSVTIAAEVHSDDWGAEATFDATPFFEQASDEQLEALAKIGFRGDYAADAVAEHVQHTDADVGAVFTYVSTRRAVESIGFECSVDPDEAVRWIAKHRPSLYAALCDKSLVDEALTA